MPNMHNFDPNDFPDFGRPESIETTTGIETARPPHSGQATDPKLVERPVNEYSKTLHQADQEGLIQMPDDVSGISEHATTSEETKPWWKRPSRVATAGAAVLTAAGLVTTLIIAPWSKKEPTDSEGSTSNPSATAIAGANGAGEQHGTVIDTEANTATIQAQPSTEQRDGQGAGDPQGTQEALPSPLTGSIDPNKVDPTFSPESSKTLNVTINGEQVKLHTLPVLARNASQAEIDNYFNRIMELQSAALTIYLQNPKSPDFDTVMGALIDDPTFYSRLVEDAQQLQTEVPAGSKPVVVIHDGADMPAHFRVGTPANNGKGEIDWSDPQTGATYISKIEGTGGIIVDVVDGKKYDWGQVPDVNEEPFARQILTGVRASQINNVGDNTSILKYYYVDKFNPNN